MLWLLSIATPWQAGGGQASGRLWASGAGKQGGKRWAGKRWAAGRVGGQRADMLQPFRGVLALLDSLCSGHIFYVLIYLYMNRHTEKDIHAMYIRIYAYSSVYLS